MEIILGIIVLVFGISIYDYLASRNWQQVTSSTRNEVVFEHRNREYGAYVIRRDYNTGMIIIMLSVMLSIGAAYGIYKIIQAIPEEIVPPPPVDDSTFAVAAPPVEEETPPPPPEEEIPELEKTVQFLPPVVTDNPDVEEPVTVDETQDTKVGQTDQQGTGDGFDDPIPSGPAPVDIPDPEPLTVVDEPADFPGGRAAMMAFLRDNLQYPQTAIENDLQGKCYLKFVVDKNGNISRVSVTRGVAECPECDKEAKRVVLKMPKWTPGKVGGKNVDQWFNLPIVFKLQ